VPEIFLFLLWIGYLVIKYKPLKYSLLILIGVLVFSFSLYRNGIINSDFQVNSDRLFYVNSHYFDHITRFQTWSVYLPYRFRPFIYANWIIPINVFGRAISLFWFDKVLAFTGPVFILPLVIGTVKAIQKKWLAPFLIIFATCLAAGLARDPNLGPAFVLVLPQLVTLMVFSLAK